MILDLDVADAGEFLELRDRRFAREPEFDLMVGQIAQRIHAVDPDDATVADDGHAVAAPFDLTQDVARKKDRPAVGHSLAQQREESLLDERIQPGGWLIEEEQFGLVLQRGDEAHLLLVALRVFTEAAARVEIEPLDQLGLVSTIHAAAQVAEVLERLSAGESVVQRELAGQVA